MTNRTNPNYISTFRCKECGQLIPDNASFDGVHCTACHPATKATKQEEIKMSFKDLFTTFIAGTPIKRKVWRGYWKYDPRTKDIKIFTKEGKVILFTETEDLLFTISGILQDDWEIATNENCDIEVK